MDEKNSRTMTLTITALLTAMTLLATMLFKIPVGLGYIHLGDVFVVLAALMLPRRYACFSAGAGAALADVLGGFAVWAPWTLVIKAVVVLIISLSLGRAQINPADEEKSKNATFPALIGVTAAAIWTAASYYAAEGIIYGNWTAPLAGVPFNILQLIVGAVLAQLLFSAYKRIRR